MAYILKLLPFAYKDLIKVKEWYNDQREGLGEEFKLEVNKEMDYLISNPDHYQQKFKELRQSLINRFPYTIYSLKDDNLKQIIIFGVLHSKRNPKIISKRLK
jgi:plasmid stabilization system protein ParE